MSKHSFLLGQFQQNQLNLFTKHNSRALQNALKLRFGSFEDLAIPPSFSNSAALGRLHLSRARNVLGKQKLAT